jgi:ADP-heptose:LPS heptosyltransferase
LIGLPWAREFAERSPSLDRFEAFPGLREWPERVPDTEAMPGFIERMRARRFDLLIQLHGSGSVINALLADFGARHVAGFVDPGGFCAEPALHTAWPREGHEIERLLRLIDHLGLPRQGTHLDFALTDADHAALARAVPELDLAAGCVCVHPGAQLPSRRWLPERFAAVADALAGRGLQVVVTGTEGERHLATAIRACMRHEALDLAGRTDLFALGALIGQARLLVSNDTGVQHLAAALGTPSVAVSSGAEVARWAPLDAARHRVLWHDLPCRPCAHRVCPTAHECARGVGVDDVAAAAFGALGAV